MLMGYAYACSLQKMMACSKDWKMGHQYFNLSNILNRTSVLHNNTTPQAFLNRTEIIPVITDNKGETQLMHTQI